VIALNRLRLLIASLLVLALVLTWQFGWRTQTENEQFLDAQGRIDWYVEEGVLTRYAPQGTRLSVTDARQITHFENRQVSELEQPYAVGYNADQSVSYTLSAERAYYPDNNSRLDLEGKVELEHNPSTEMAVAMFTPTLTYFPERELAVTADSVEIETSSGHTRAVGMEFYTAERRMELLSQVRGNYVTTESQSN